MIPVIPKETNVLLQPIKLIRNSKGVWLRAPPIVPKTMAKATTLLKCLGGRYKVPIFTVPKKPQEAPTPKIRRDRQAISKLDV